jgi:adenylate cyclase class 1
VDPDKSMGPFAELVELGGQMSRFMFQTYAAIQAMLGEHEVGAMVTREDLTKIGRKVFSYLRPRPNKVMRLPFLESTVELFAGLEFAAEAAPGRLPIWIARGEHHKQQGRKLAKEEIRRAKTLEELLVWLTANEAYHPKIPLKAAQLDKFTSLPDITAALTALRETFPARATFDTDINQNLQPEQAVRALLLINLCVPREDRQFRRVALVYSTNWGELFCVTQPKALERLRQSGHDFVRANVGRVGPDLEVRVFTPARALCPQVLV